MTPTPEFQLKFLDYIQRFLDGGGFVASYKFALLMALADLSVEKGDDSGASLPLHARDVALVFIRYYARQSRPYPGADDDRTNVLHQNTDKQAAIVGLVREEVATYSHGPLQASIAQLKKNKKLVGKVTSNVAIMPLWRLQTIGGKVDDFLYKNEGKGRQFELRPGIAYCFRRFHGFIYRLAQDGWIRFVRERKQNAHLLGEATDLAQFMFGAERTTLVPYQELLTDIQKGQCFYCGQDKKSQEVDHFIPWSWYSLDLGHNFVLACRECNGKKRDMLAAPLHLDNWFERNMTFESDMASFFDSKNLPHDWDSSLLVAQWAYGRVAGAEGYTWVRGKEFKRISTSEGWGFPTGQ